MSKSLLGFLVCAGECLAVGVPVAMYTVGGGNEKEVVLKHCETGRQDGVREIGFGESSSKKVCWSLSTEDQTLTNKDTFTEFFNSNWKKATEDKLDWTFHDDSKWKQQCESVKNKWGMSNSENEVERLGLCEKDDHKDTPFVKKQKSSKDSNSTLKLWVCDRDCWDSASSSNVGGSTILQKENSGNWKEVKFREE